MVKESKNLFGLYFSANIISVSIPFLAIPYFTEILGPSEYAKVGVFFSVIAGLNCIIGLNGTGLLLKKQVSEKPEEANLYLKSTLTIAFISAMITAVISVSGLTYFELTQHVSLIISAIIAALSFYIIKCQLIILQIQKQAKKYALLQISIPLISIISAYFCFTFLTVAEARTLSYSASVLVISVFVISNFFKNKIYSGKVDWDHYRQLLMFGTPLLFHTFSIFSLLHLDKILLTKLISKSELGIYVLATQLSSISSHIYDALQKTILPGLYEKLRTRYSLKEFNQFITRYFLASLVINCSLIFCIICVFEHIFSSEFNLALKIIPILILGHAFQGIYLYSSATIFYFEKTVSFTLLSILTTIIYVFIFYLFVDRYGVVGAAYAFSVSMLIRAITVYTLSSYLVRNETVFK